jgi:hypothetical protein
MKTKTLIMKTKTLFLTLFTMFIVTIGVIGLYQNSYFKAALIDGVPTNNTDTDLYISNAYTALSKDSGNIEIKTENGLQDVVAISFTLNYNPKQIHISNEYILGNLKDAQGNAVKPQLISVTPNNNEGKTVIDIANAQSFFVDKDSVLISLPITIQDDVLEATKVSVNFSETELIDNNFNILSVKTSDGTIEIQGAAAESLSVQESESISETEIAVYFDDFLQTANQVALETTGNIQGTSIQNEINFDTGVIASDNGKKLLLQTDFIKDSQGVNQTQFQSSDIDAEFLLQNNAIISNTQVDAGLGVNNISQILAKNTEVVFAGNNNIRLISDTTINTQTFFKDTSATAIQNNELTFVSGTKIEQRSNIVKDSLFVLNENPFSNIVLGKSNHTLPQNTIIQDTHQLGAQSDVELISNTDTEVFLRIEVTNDTNVSGTGFSTTLVAGTSIEVDTNIIDLNNFLDSDTANIKTHTTTEDHAIQYNDNGTTRDVILPTGEVLNIIFEVKNTKDSFVRYKTTLSSDVTVTAPQNTAVKFNSQNIPMDITTPKAVRNALKEGKTYKIHFTTGPQGNIKTNLDTTKSTSYFTVASQTLGSVAITNTRNAGINTIALQLSGTLTDIQKENPTKYFVFDSEGKNLAITKVQQQERLLNISLKNPLINQDNYFVIAENIRDMSQEKIGFFQAELQGETKVISINPVSIPLEGGTMSISGENLQEIESITINNKNIDFSGVSNSEISLQVSAQLEAGNHDIQFLMKSGQTIMKQNFMSVEDQKVQIRVLSEESYALPQRVPNDGETKTILWALIEDPRGVGDINKVTLDLRPIGGKAIARMNGKDEDGQFMMVDNKRWFFLETTIPSFINTSEEARKINVTAEDPHGNKAKGTISLVVTKNIKSSELPEIINARSTPEDVRVGETLGLFVQVKDLDGVSDIDTVIADLSSIGLGPKILSPISGEVVSSKKVEIPSSPVITGDPSQNPIPAQVAPKNNQSSSIPQERITQWYGIEGIEISNTLDQNNYEIPFIVNDMSGGEGSFTLKVLINKGAAPRIDSDRIQITPRSNVPNNGKDLFSVSSFISDEDGIEDITSVMLDTNEIGGIPIEMERQGEVRPGQKGATFIAKDLVVTEETRVGHKELIIYAYDAQGNQTKEDFDLDVTNENEQGDAASIDSTRSYTTPASIAPDEATKLSLNVFVEQHDFTITQVMADLSNIAKYTGEPNDKESCLGATERIVCLKPGLQEGTRGQWYTLDNIVVLKTTQSSLEPYRIRVTAIDEKGKTGDGFIFLNVGDGILPTPQTGFPKVQMAISTAVNKVEVLFSNPINPKTVAPGAFKLSLADDTSSTLPITDVVLNSDATVATLFTGIQTTETFYTIFADAQILGLKEAQYTDNHADFVGFDKQPIPPQLTKVHATSSNLLEVVFSEGLKPSSVDPFGRDFQIFTNEQKPVRLKVHHAEFQDDNQTLRISTDAQQSGKRYTLRVKNIYSAAGVRVGGNERARKTAKKEHFGIHKNFIGFKVQPKERQNIIESVDFDGNGKIDFVDFTIFSSVYGQNLNNFTEKNKSEFQPTPLNSPPNALSPDTSEATDDATERFTPIEPVPVNPIDIPQGIQVEEAGL